MLPAVCSCDLFFYLLIFFLVWCQTGRATFMPEQDRSTTSRTGSGTSFSSTPTPYAIVRCTLITCMHFSLKIKHLFTLSIMQFCKKCFLYSQNRQSEKSHLSTQTHFLENIVSSPFVQLSRYNHKRTIIRNAVYPVCSAGHLISMGVMLKCTVLLWHTSSRSRRFLEFVSYQC